MNVRTKFEVRSFTHSWDNRGYSKNWTVPAYAHAPFSPKFLTGFCSDDTVNVAAKFAVRSFIRSWDNSDCSFWVANPRAQSWRRGGRRRSGMVLFDRALVNSYRPSVVTFHTRYVLIVFTRFGDTGIAAFVLLCSITPLSPTSSLPQISLCSPGNKWMAFGLRRAKANCPCN